MTPPIPPQLADIARVFARRGRRAYLVGGAVRDMLRGVPAKDFDLATDAPPGEVRRMFRSVIPTGIKHGTVTVRRGGLDVEVTTFRAESGYSDGRHPDAVRFAATIEEDLSRRDFTMNAMALSLPDGALVDPFGGKADVERALIRCVGRAGERFAEDGLRPLRALRFCARLGFAADGELLDAIRPALPVTARVSAERVRDEFTKIVMADTPLPALRHMEATGLLGLILPELAACRGVEQKGLHAFDVLDHSLYALEWSARQGDPLAARLAALFHDLGKKARARRGADGVWTFYGHEAESADLADAVMTRLRYSNAEKAAVVHLVREHMFHYESAWHDAAVRRFIARVGEGCLDGLFRLRRADTYALKRAAPPAGMPDPFERRVADTLARARMFSIKDLAIDGRDVIALGAAEGRAVGAVLRELFDAAVADPALNTRETLLEMARAALKRAAGSTPSANASGATGWGCHSSAGGRLSQKETSPRSGDDPIAP